MLERVPFGHVLIDLQVLALDERLTGVICSDANSPRKQWRKVHRVGGSRRGWSGIVFLSNPLRRPLVLPRSTTYLQGLLSSTVSRSRRTSASSTPLSVPAGRRRRT